MKANYVSGTTLPKDFDLCSSIADIDKKVECMRYLSDKANLRDVDLRSVVDTLNERAKDSSNLTYFTIDGVEVDETDASSHYKLFNTGYKTVTENPIYFSLYRYGGTWRGAYVVTFSEFKAMLEEYYNDQVIKAECKSYITERKDTPLEQRARAKATKKATAKPEIFSLDAVNKRWQEVINYVRTMCCSPTWVFDSVDKLTTYLYALESRVCGVLKRKNNIEPEMCDCIIFNKTQTHVYINTGITNRLSKNIFVACEIQKDVDNFKSISVIKCRDALIDLNFSMEAASQKPRKISFYKEKEVPLFMGSISDVDIENPHSVTHCMIDNVERLPEYIQGMSEEERIDLYFKKLQLSFDRQSVDTFYFKPFYSIANDSIEFIIPCYADDDSSNSIEFGFMLGRTARGFWNICTLLSAEQCKGNIQILQPFQKL